MSAILDYLTTKSLEPNEWLRREPRETHPEILALVREITTASDPSRTLYDEDVERYVHEKAGDLPEYLRHAHPLRDPLIIQLGHEVYIARIVLRDEENTAALAALREDGFIPIEDYPPVDGARYVVVFGTLYSGYSVPVYGLRYEVRARVTKDGKIALMPKGARTRGFNPSLSSSVLVRAL